MSAPNEKPEIGHVPDMTSNPAQAYAPPTAVQPSREPDTRDMPKVQIAAAVRAAPSGTPFAPQAMAPAPGGYPPAPSAPGQPALPFAPAPAPSSPAAGSYPPAPGTAASGLPFAAPAAPAAPPTPSAPTAPAVPDASVASGAAPEAAAAPPPAAAEDDAGLAASPWNTSGGLGLNRDLLPSAMLAPAPPREAATGRPAARPEPVAETPSRAPWIVVGVLAVVAVVGAILVVQLAKKDRGSGQIAIPAGASSIEDAPVDTAPTMTATATAAPVVRQPVKPKTYLDDPYADVPVRPKGHAAPSSAPTPTAAPHRLFGTEN